MAAHDPPDQHNGNDMSVPLRVISDRDHLLDTDALEVQRIERLLGEAALTPWFADLTFTTVDGAAVHPGLVRRVEDALAGACPAARLADGVLSLTVSLTADGQAGDAELSRLAVAVTRIAPNLALQHKERFEFDAAGALRERLGGLGLHDWSSRD